MALSRVQRCVVTCPSGSASIPHRGFNALSPLFSLTFLSAYSVMLTFAGSRPSFAPFSGPKWGESAESSIDRERGNRGVLDSAPRGATNLPGSSPNADMQPPFSSANAASRAPRAPSSPLAGRIRPLQARSGRWRRAQARQGPPGIEHRRGCCTFWRCSIRQPPRRHLCLYYTLSTRLRTAGCGIAVFVL